MDSCYEASGARGPCETSTPLAVQSEAETTLSTCAGWRPREAKLLRYMRIRIVQNIRTKPLLHGDWFEALQKLNPCEPEALPKRGDLRSKWPACPMIPGELLQVPFNGGVSVIGLTAARFCPGRQKKHSDWLVYTNFARYLSRGAGARR